MEQNYKILVADDNVGTKTSIEEKLKTNDNYTVISLKQSDDLVKAIIQEKPDAVIMDVLLPGKDGFKVLEELFENHVQTKILITTSLSSETFIAKAFSLGVSYYMIKPVDLDVLCSRVEEILSEQALPSTQSEFKNPFLSEKLGAYSASTKDTRNRYVEEKITNIFITVGIPAHIKGYQFLREAILMAIDNPDIINSITKQLYPNIATKFETTSSKVERAIRHAIDVAWNRGKIENINNVFGIKVYSRNEKPTNGEFIALVADKMLLEG